MSIKENILRLNARGGEPIVLDNDLNNLLNQLIDKEVYAENIDVLILSLIHI